MTLNSLRGHVTSLNMSLIDRECTNLHHFRDILDFLLKKITFHTPPLFHTKIVELPQDLDRWACDWGE